MGKDTGISEKKFKVIMTLEAFQQFIDEQDALLIAVKSQSEKEKNLTNFIYVR